ncbi:protein PHLOEM PROTEIN 2-LIKE A2-like isoform X1 [Dendrobium catenatum]|uniref:protein PHLOEM PROTEIN 2-LIKE A2-like isoform X1 n=1 Tax=Dendrobium catenatum TaxID=906689 RepID=UPI0009F2156A|nr:protein PHLOEM PROTEIN 2-LIKE A2-like isoform X1 [Dendrobium catenatum]
MTSGEIHGPHWTGEHNYEYFKNENGVYHISAKALRIVWGNDPRFWEWIKLSKDESCFEIGAELIQVNWMEVTGSLNLEKFQLDPLKTYEIFYVIKFNADAFGWRSSPITFEVSTPEGKKSRNERYLEYYTKENKNWNEIYGGEFSLASSNLMGKIEFGMKEVKTEWWKGGIVLEGVKIRPKLLIANHN